MENLKINGNPSLHYGQFEDNNLLQPKKNNIKKTIRTNARATASFKKVNSMRKTLKSIINKTIASNELGAVLILQLVDQKQITDLFGHYLGKTSMEFVKLHINACLRLEDHVEQVSEDEFAIVLENLESPNNATVIAQRIIDGCVGEQAIEGQSIYIMATVKVKAIP